MKKITKSTIVAMALATLGMSINGFAIAGVLVGGGDDISLPGYSDPYHPGVPGYELPGGIGEVRLCDADQAAGLSFAVVQTIAGINGFGSELPTSEVEAGRHTGYVVEFAYGTVEGEPRFRASVAKLDIATCEVRSIGYRDDFQMVRDLPDVPVEACDRELALDRATLVGEAIATANGYQGEPTLITSRVDLYNGTTVVRIERDLGNRVPTHTVRITASCRVGSISYEDMEG